MTQVLSNIRNLIIKVLDWLYPPFSRLIPKQIFRYAATGGTNQLFDIALYALIYAVILDGQMIHLGPITISDHIAAFLMVFPITFTTGFLFARYITFTNSHIGGKTQLLRYLGTVIGAIALNYFLLKLFVEVLGINAIIANMMNKVIIVSYSYLMNYNFSFQSKKGSKYI